MGWKKWPYWLRGGIIGLGIFLLIIVILMSLANVLPRTVNFKSDYPSLYSLRESSWELISHLDIIGILLCQGFCIGEEGMTQILSMPISYTLYGIIIGFIMGKIKPKEEQ